MNTYNIKVTATKVSPFSGLDIYNVLNGGSFVDPFANPLSFYYPLTSFGNIQESSNIIYTTKYFSISAQELFTQDIFFKSDGTSLYAIGAVTDDVYEYEMSTPWDISTASYNGNFYSNNEENTPTALFFKNDGSKMYLLGDTKKRIFEYNLTDWDISTVSYSNSYFIISSQEPSPRGLHFKPDGTKMYVLGLSSKRIHEYNLSIPWDISSAIYSTKNFSVSTEELSAQGLFFKSDGSAAYIIGLEKDTLFQYPLSTYWDISTAYYNSNYYNLSSEDYEFVGIFFRNDGYRLYAVANNRDRVYEYDLVDPWVTYNPNTNFYNLTTFGGNFKICYNDLKLLTFDMIGKSLYCSTNVVFDFSEFDSTKSKIIKLIFDPDNGRELQTYEGIMSGNTMLYPILSNIPSDYYPSEKFYTLFFPKFKIEYEDGNMVSLVYPLTVTQCGIFEAYKDKTLIESLPYYKNLSNILLFINDKINNNFFIHDIDTRLPFVLSSNLPEDIQLPFVITPVPLGGGAFVPLEQPIVPLPPTNPNPVTPPLPYYIYSQDLGVFIVPNNSIFYETEEFNTNNSLIILSGGAPYFGGTGVIINVFSV